MAHNGLLAQQWLIINSKDRAFSAIIDTVIGTINAQSLEFIISYCKYEDIVHK